MKEVVRRFSGGLWTWLQALGLLALIAGLILLVAYIASALGFGPGCNSMVDACF